ncbi:MAG: hypothetical protein ABL894_09275 [Hyphomicrobium sp.]
MENLNNFQILEYVAWGLSVILGLWMLFDMIKTNSAYSEDVLMSSKEGEIDDGRSVQSTNQGAGR